MPFQAVFSTFDLISEFTHFNPVIRLSKVKQLAFSSIFTLPFVDVLNNCPLCLGLTIFKGFCRLSMF